MLSFSSLVLMGLLSISNGLECSSEGCYYNAAFGVTQNMECKPDGRLEVNWTYISPLENPFCTPEINWVCRETRDCLSGYYCFNDVCIENPCYHENVPVTDECDDNNDCINIHNDCYCEPDGHLLNDKGRCVPVDEESSPTTYSITIDNDSGATAIIGIFQKNPSDEIYTSGYPIVFATRSIENGGSGTFQWDVQWGLSWAGNNGCSYPLTSNIIYSRNGKIIEVSPGDINNNGAYITYKADADVWEISAKAVPSLKLDELALQTNSNFAVDTAEKDCFTVAVTMDGNTIFAMDGKPSSEYLFELSPTYYLTTTLSKIGETVSGAAVSQSKEVVFKDGKNDVQCILSEYLQFSCEPDNRAQ